MKSLHGENSLLYNNHTLILYGPSMNTKSNPLPQWQLSELIEHAYAQHDRLHNLDETDSLMFCENSGLMAYTIGIDPAEVFADKFVEYMGQNLTQ